MTEALVSYRSTRDGLTLLERHWSHADPRAAVVIVHGLNEHCGRYAAVADQLVGAGFAVWSYDQRSFGRSQGRTRCYVDRFDQLLDDLEDVLTDVAAQGRPVVVLGHSMGGLVTAAYAISDRSPAAAYVLTDPALGVEAPWWQAGLVSVVSRLAPRATVAGAVDSKTLSRDEAVQTAYDDDPLVQESVSARLAAEMFATIEATRERLDRIDRPMLVLHGADDRLVPPRVSAPLGSVPGVRRELLPGLRHEILNEPEGPDIVARIVDWIDETLAAAGEADQG